jgi:hypothetical protein
MQKYLNVYLTELKQQIKPYLISVFVFLILSGFYYLNITQFENNNKNTPGFLFPIFLVLFFFTQLMIFAYYLKEKFLKESNYLLYSLPTKRYPVLLIKFIVFITYLIISLMILFPWSFLHAHILVVWMKTAYPGLHYPFESGFLNFVLNNTMCFFMVKLFSILAFFLSGVFIFIKTLHYQIKWFNIILQTITAMIFLLLFSEFALVDTVMHSTIVGPLSIIFGIFAGIFFLIIGLRIFEKYGEI